jgi:hypothetical protein
MDLTQDSSITRPQGWRRNGAGERDGDQGLRNHRLYARTKREQAGLHNRPTATPFMWMAAGEGGFAGRV